MRSFRIMEKTYNFKFFLSYLALVVLFYIVKVFTGIKTIGSLIILFFIAFPLSILDIFLPTGFHPDSPNKYHTWEIWLVITGFVQWIIIDILVIISQKRDEMNKKMQDETIKKIGNNMRRVKNNDI